MQFKTMIKCIGVIAIALLLMLMIPSGLSDDHDEQEDDHDEWRGDRHERRGHRGWRGDDDDDDNDDDMTGDDDDDDDGDELEMLESFIYNDDEEFWEPLAENIQLAIDRTSRDGGTVYLPAGDFILAEPIQMRKKVALEGSGIGNTVIKRGDEMPGYAVITANWIRDFSIAEMTVNGNKAANTRGSCIDLKRCNDFTVRDVYLTNPNWSGLRIWGMSRDGTIRNVLASDIDGPFQGIDIHQAEDLEVSDCTVWQSNDSWGMDFSQVHDSTFENLFVYDSCFGIKIIGRDYRQTTDCTFSDLYMENIGPGDGMKIQYCTESTLGNIHINGGFNGFVVWDTCSDLTINEIYITDSANIVISIKGTGHIVTNVHVAIELYAGWNRIEWFYHTPTTASSLCAHIDGCTHVAMWNETLGDYDLYTPSQPENDFEITMGIPIHVRVNAPTIWHGEG